MKRQLLSSPSFSRTDTNSAVCQLGANLRNSLKKQKPQTLLCNLDKKNRMILCNTCSINCLRMPYKLSCRNSAEKVPCVF